MADEYGKGVAGFTNQEDRKDVESGFKEAQKKSTWEKLKSAVVPQVSPTGTPDAMERRKAKLSGSEK
jgi:hypothetical protein